MLHEKGWTVRRVDGGWQWRRPDGKLHDPRPPTIHSDIRDRIFGRPDAQAL